MLLYIAVGSITLFLFLRRHRRKDKSTQTEISCEVLSEMLDNLLKIDDDDMLIDSNSTVSMEIDTVPDNLNFRENYLNEERSLSNSDSL